MSVREPDRHNGPLAQNENLVQTMQYVLDDVIHSIFALHKRYLVCTYQVQIVCTSQYVLGLPTLWKGYLDKLVRTFSASFKYYLRIYVIIPLPTGAILMTFIFWNLVPTSSYILGLVRTRSCMYYLVCTTQYVLPSMYYLVCTTQYVLPSMYYLVCTTQYVLPSMYYLVCTTQYVLPSMYYLVCTTQYVLPSRYYLVCTTQYVLPSMYYLVCTTQYVFLRKRANVFIPNLAIQNFFRTFYPF